VPQASSRLSAARQKVVDQARRETACDKLTVASLHFDCDQVGFVRAAFWAAPIDLFAPEVASDQSLDGIAILFRTAGVRHALHQETPRIGDLVFFDRDGTAADLYPTQVGIVDGMQGDGTAAVIGWFAAGPRHIVMNVRQPDEAARDDGTEINTRLADAAESTAGRLVRAFANPYGD